MSFKSKTDFFGLGSSGLVITESNEHKQASTAEGRNSKGDIVAIEIFGETMSPTCSYVLSADTNLATMKCGTVINGTGDYSSKKFTLGSLTINTSSGQPPSIEAQGEEIPSTASHSDCTYTFPATTLKQCHHAQILWEAFSLSGEGCYLS
jgi:hypothetical protein